MPRLKITLLWQVGNYANTAVNLGICTPRNTLVIKNPMQF